MKKVLCIFGTRPEAIKMVPVVGELKKSKKFAVKVVLTAQHRGMLDQVMGLFKLKPDYDLNIMRKSQSLDYITAKALQGIQAILKKEKPALVLVHGDTTTSLAGALAAYYQGIPAGHVEAGLRSDDRDNPFPEEMNRRLVDTLCSIHFAHTVSAKENLNKENIRKNVFITGNTVIDSLLMVLKMKKGFKCPGIKAIDFNKRIILVTAHRRENWGKPLEGICTALKKLKKKYDDVEFVYPVHLNPAVKNMAYSIIGETRGIHLLPPLEYTDLVGIVNKSYIVLTDSGGLQEEAPSLGKPVLVMRKVTERPEAVTAGTVKVVGTDGKVIFNEVSRLLDNSKVYRKMANAVNPYGDGKAAKRITKLIAEYLGRNKI